MSVEEEKVTVNAAPESGAARAEEIDYRNKGDILDIMAAEGTGRRQPLQGFTPNYNDIVDYIVLCTHKIWEEGGIGLLYEHYPVNSVAWSDWGTIYGREDTAAHVVEGLTAYPDLRLFAEDVIWTGDDRQGFRTSHRLTGTGHNYGPSKYGPPTGRWMQRRSIANCVVRENRIHEEWLVQDELAVVRQLGLDVDAVLQRLTEELAARPPTDVVGEVPRVHGQATPARYEPRHPHGFDVEDFVRLAISEIWNWRRLDRIPAYYADNTPFHGPSGRELYGPGAIRALVLAILAAFPDGMLSIDDLYWNGNEGDGYRVAIRWSFLGTHRRAGIFGRATGRQVRIIGSTQQRITDGKIREEWTIFNELALLWKLHYA